MLPLEYMQIRVYYNPDTDIRKRYSCQCECTLTLGAFWWNIFLSGQHTRDL